MARLIFLVGILLALAAPRAEAQFVSPTDAPSATICQGGTSTGSANAQVVACQNGGGFTLRAGATASFIAGFTNTSTTTLAIGGTTATEARLQTAGVASTAAMIGSELAAGSPEIFVYDGTYWVRQAQIWRTTGAGATLGATSTANWFNIGGVWTGTGTATTITLPTSATTYKGVIFYNAQGGPGTVVLTTGADLINGVVGASVTIPRGTLAAIYNAANGNYYIAGAQFSPAINSCGTGSPTVTGTDGVFQVLAGGGALTACSINFGVTQVAAPLCTVSPASSTVTAGLYVTTTTTAATLNNAVALTSGAYNVTCPGAM